MRNSDEPPTGGDGSVDLRHLDSRASLGSILVLLLLAALTALCLTPLVWVVAVALPGNFTLWMILYFAALPLVLIPRLEFLQARIVCPGSRRPTPDELARLTPLWDSVLDRAASGRSRRYRLRVSDDHRINAAASGGSLVIVTTRALRDLSDSRLEAVLAHELGHHAGARPIMLLIQQWLVRPIEWAARLSAPGHSLLAWIETRRMRRRSLEAERQAEHAQGPQGRGPFRRRRGHVGSDLGHDRRLGKRGGRRSDGRLGRRAGRRSDRRLDGRGARSAVDPRSGRQPPTRRLTVGSVLRWTGRLLVALAVLLIRLGLVALDAIVWAATRCTAFLGHRAQYAADVVAVRLGYGPELIEALAAAEEPDAASHDLEQTDRRDQRDSPVRPFRDIHPPTSARISRIRDSL